MKTISNIFSIENKKSTAIFLKILLLGLFAIMFMAVRPETASAASSTSSASPAISTNLSKQHLAR